MLRLRSSVLSLSIRAASIVPFASLHSSLLPLVLFSVYRQ